MRTDSTSYKSTTYKQFLSIDAGEYKEKIRFVGLHSKDLKELPLAEYMQVMDGYAEALFETGRYEEHSVIADHIIEESIVHNIVDLGGKDLYFETLFQKAASLYNLERTDDAIYILCELLKMQSGNESCRLFLINCFIKKRSATLLKVRHVALAVILSSAFIIACELLIIKPFLPSFADTIEIVRNGLFLAGAGGLIIGELSVRYQAVREMQSIETSHKQFDL